MNEPNKDLIVTPGGPRPKDLVHEVGPGQVVRFDEGQPGAVISREELLPQPIDSVIAQSGE